MNRSRIVSSRVKVLVLLLLALFAFSPRVEAETCMRQFRECVMEVDIIYNSCIAASNTTYDFFACNNLRDWYLFNCAVERTMCSTGGGN